MAPQVQSLDSILAGLNPAYAPSEALYNQQIAAIPGQQQAAQAGLDQTKTNSFHDINTSANSKGLAFSGIPSSEQATYLGGTYLPAVAKLKSDSQNQQMTLQQALASLESDKYKTGLSTQQDQQKVLDSYNQQQQQNAFDAQQKELDREASASGSGGLSAYQAAELQNKAASQYKASIFKSGNYNFTGPNGAPISMATYAQATGNNILDLLRNSGSQYDKNAYQDATYWLSKGGEALAESNLQKKYPKLF